MDTRPYYLLQIPQMDILMEDYSSVFSVIEHAAKDRQKLIDLRSSCDVIFSSYDHDPREIPDIPEACNWVRKSLGAGVPWLYILGFKNEKCSTLTLFAIICCGNPIPNMPGRYALDREKFQAFVDQNYKNLEILIDKYHLPVDLVGQTANNAIDHILSVFFGKEDASSETEEPAQVSRQKQIEEAEYRLSRLERLFGLNPNVKTYFSEGKVYYSYLTFGGYIGSVDAITYDDRYAQLAADFESGTSAVVYHAIEHQNTLALLYVSAEMENWEAEQPQHEGVLAFIYDWDSDRCEHGYIKLDALQGALYRRTSKIYTSLDTENHGIDRKGSAVDAEIIKRLQILCNQGMQTDLDVIGLYTRNKELCYSEPTNVFGSLVGVVQRMSSNPAYKRIIDQISAQTDNIPYFFMSTLTKSHHRIAILFVSPDASDWDDEKEALRNQEPDAIVVDLDRSRAHIANIEYRFANGGPVYIPE